ncbi:hypothetical protein GQ457_07G001060 [Hibiscus cannabinus]
MSRLLCGLKTSPANSHHSSRMHRRAQGRILAVVFSMKTQVTVPPPPKESGFDPLSNRFNSLCFVPRPSSLLESGKVLPIKVDVPVD